MHFSVMSGIGWSSSLSAPAGRRAPQTTREGAAIVFRRNLQALLAHDAKRSGPRRRQRRRMADLEGGHFAVSNVAVTQTTANAEKSTWIAHQHPETKEVPPKVSDEAVVKSTKDGIMAVDDADGKARLPVATASVPPLP